MADTIHFNRSSIFFLLLLIISEILMFLKINPFYTWFYPLIWWIYILLADSIIFSIKNNSLIRTRKKEIFIVAFWSLIIWLIFEVFNIYMKNWHYVNVISLKWLRWPGIIISFATVLPGIFETFELLDTIGILKGSGLSEHLRIKVTPYILNLFSTIGLIFLISPIVLPKYCFPLVWGGFIFLLEPFIYKSNGRSILREWENGSLKKFWLLLLSGMICGLLWEFWNFWAPAKWIYTLPIPALNRLKIFEMPLAGFLGFPPFAVECYVMYNFIALFRSNKGWEEDTYLIEDSSKKYILNFLSIVAAFIFIYAALTAIDIYTIHSFS